jgi:soluble lytic murein transglycosylase
MAERLADPEFSVRYGARYLSILMNKPAIKGDLVRMLAGYNAGPGAVAGWQNSTKTIDDPLLYIESIPYPETRNYVLQVMAQYWVYQQLLGENSTTLTAIARGQWPQING